jgi:hypothetical protein
MNPRTFGREVLWAGAAATILSGIPSTAYAIWAGRDVWEAMRAAGAMLIPADSSALNLLWAAALVHCSVSFFWAAVLVLTLPRRRVVLSSVLAGAAIGLFDLKVMGRFFPEVQALHFGSQMADHVMWGLCLGMTLWMLRRLESGEVGAKSKERRLT